MIIYNVASRNRTCIRFSHNPHRAERRTLERATSGRVISVFPIQMELAMDREHVKGAADKVKGAIKDAAGKVTGDRKLQTEGKIDKAKGAAHNAAGDVKDAVRKAGE
jgi:uncharacterized protein YjbJ (UPF0337 family)